MAEGDYTWKCKRGHTIGKNYKDCQLCIMQDFREEQDKLKVEKTRQETKTKVKQWLKNTNTRRNTIGT